MKQTGSKIELPPVGYAGYITDYMHKIGFPSPSEGCVKHAEIKAWAEMQGLDLNPTEYQIIFDSFIEYNSSKMRFEKTKAEPAPFTTKTAEEVQQASNDAMNSLMNRMLNSGD